MPRAGEPGLLLQTLLGISRARPLAASHPVARTPQPAPEAPPVPRGPPQPGAVPKAEGCARGERRRRWQSPVERPWRGGRGFCRKAGFPVQELGIRYLICGHGIAKTV